MTKQAKIYGVLADFDNPEDLIEAVRKTRRAGYLNLDTYTPFPIESMNKELGQPHTRISMIVFICGVVGGVT